MIEWIKIEENNQPSKDVRYLVTNGLFIEIAEVCEFVDDTTGWVTDEGEYLTDVTHYTEMNLPKEEGTR